MKPHLTLICLLMFSITIFGQHKSCDIPLRGDKDSTLWFSWSKTIAAKIGLPNLMVSRDSLHFRFWTETQAIDIWTNNFKTFYGSLANYTTSENKDPNDKNPEKFYSKTSRLNSLTAKNIYALFDKFSAFDIPSDEKIKGWYQGQDGESFWIENATPFNYSLKTYWSPSEYKEIKEAVIIDTLEKKLYKMLPIKNNWGKFIRSLPKGCYRAGGFGITCNDWTLPLPAKKR